MHLIVPFAVPLPDAAGAAAKGLQRPWLQALLNELPVCARELDDAWSLSPPHERAFARAVGWVGRDGAWPFAAHEAAALGIDTGSAAWARFTPAHWHLGTEQVSLTHPAALALDDAGARSLFASVQPFMAEAGWQLAWGRADAWFARHESLADVPTASLDRVIGRNVDAWLGQHPAARRLRGLQAELQMLLHAHPLNAERQARGLLPVNSLWISGCGVRQAVRAGAEPVFDRSLCEPALAGDWAAWCKAWEVLDADALAALHGRLLAGEAVSLTLAGERGSLTLAGVRRGAWQRQARRLWPQARPDALLQGL